MGPRTCTLAEAAGIAGSQAEMHSGSRSARSAELSLRGMRHHHRPCIDAAATGRENKKSGPGGDTSEEAAAKQANPHALPLGKLSTVRGGVQRKQLEQLRSTGGKGSGKITNLFTAENSSLFARHLQDFGVGDVDKLRARDARERRARTVDQRERPRRTPRNSGAPNANFARPCLPSRGLTSGPKTVRCTFCV